MKTKPDDIFSLGLSDATLIRHLPQLLADIARLVGVEAAVKIGCQWGGGELYLPVTLTEDKGVVEVIGLEAATKLATHYGQSWGVKLQIPSTMGRFHRRMTAIKLLKSGCSLREVALTVGMGRSSVQVLRRDFQNFPL